MKQLILIEGLPGTGKTTITQTIAEYLIAKGESPIPLYEESLDIPTNFYEIAGIPIGIYDDFCASHPQAVPALSPIVVRTPDYIFLSLNRCPEYIANAFRQWDMGDEDNTHISVSEYIPCALARLDHWVASNSVNNSNNIVLIDSGFLQNPINELLFRMASDSQIILYINGIAQRLKPLNPICVYLKRESAKAAIDFAKMAKGPDWSAGIDALLADSHFANFFDRRFNLELSLLPAIPHIICNVFNNDWSDAKRQINSIF